MPVNSLLIAALLLLALVSCSDDPAQNTSQDQHSTAPVEQVLEVFEVGETVYVRSLKIEEETGSLWVGTSLGVHEIDLADQQVLNTFTREHGLANEYVFAIGIDPDGYKWFGTNAGGMSSYKDGTWKTYFPMHGLADYWVYSFANHPDGGLWIGTWAGVNYLNRKTGEFQTYVTELVNEWVYGIGVDRKGDVWFGTEGGISRFDGEAWQAWTHREGLGAPNVDQLPFSRNTGLGTRSRHDLGILTDGKPTYNPNYVFSILIDLEDTVWAGTWGGGVSHFVSGEWQNLTTQDGLAGNIVYSLAQDPQGIYWFGTNGGLSRFDGKSFTSYGVHQGLPGNDVYAVAVDPNGGVWAGTRGGVVHLGFKDAP